MSTFSASTQARHWLFSPAALAAAQQQRHQASAAPAAAGPAATLKRARPADDEAAEAGGGGGGKRARAEDGAAAAAAAAAPLPAGAYPALAEEQHLLGWCGLALQRMCRGAQLDRAVTATAHAYLRRFYVRGLFAHYPPQEMLTSALFLAIKAEACPHTEVEELILRTLRPLDSRWRAECCALALAAAAAARAAAPAAADAASAAPAAAAAEAAPPATSPRSLAEPDPQYLANEVPLLSGLRFHVTVHHAYRPLRALLRAALSAHTSAGASSGAPAAPVDVAAWDALQARATQLVDAAALTDAPLLATPAHVALAALALAAEAGVVVEGGGAGALTLRGAGSGALGEAEAPPAAAAAAAAVQLFPALCAPPPPALAPWVAEWARSQLSGAGAAGSSASASASTSATPSEAAGEGGAPATLASKVALVQAQVTAFLSAWGTGARAPASEARALAALTALEAARDPSLLPGTPQHGARVEALRATIAAYKASKAGRAAAAAAAHGELLQREAKQWAVPALK